MKEDQLNSLQRRFARNNDDNVEEPANTTGNSEFEEEKSRFSRSDSHDHNERKSGYRRRDNDSDERYSKPRRSDTILSSDEFSIEDGSIEYRPKRRSYNNDERKSHDFSNNGHSRTSRDSRGSDDHRRNSHNDDKANSKFNSSDNHRSRGEYHKSYDNNNSDENTGSKSHSEHKSYNSHKSDYEHDRRSDSRNYRSDNEHDRNYDSRKNHRSDYKRNSSSDSHDSHKYDSRDNRRPNSYDSRISNNDSKPHSNRKYDNDSNRRFDDSKSSYTSRRSPFRSHFSKRSDENSTHKIDDGTIRLNKYIADAGYCSRRDADELIKAGSVSVNGKVINTLGYKINRTDKVQIGGETLHNEQLKYLLLNKPKGYITTMDDPQKRNTVLQLIDGACHERLFPVGRLDRNTSGLLLFTNDGELANKLMHPKGKVSKVYHVVLDKSLSKNDMDKIATGLDLEDGFIAVDSIAYTVANDKKDIGVEIHSGRNQIVRRIFSSLGYNVVKLDRTLYAGLTKKDLERGKWRFLTEKEINFLKML